MENNFVSYETVSSPSSSYGKSPIDNLTGATMVERDIPRFYHRTTTNQSFLEMSNYLKAIGVKNYRFMYSNTTNVKVKLLAIARLGGGSGNSNTTNVKVKQKEKNFNKAAILIQIQPMLRLNRRLNRKNTM